ncbi:MAG: hypothetical protein HY042_02685, partial [Spirochaetia bacterium]|nr:hypothetical protein [Spirochaetia bacterium]
MSGSAEKQPADARPAQRALTVGIETLGCRLNQFESDGVLSHFVASGRYRAVRPEDGPDIAIINTCTVTDHADTSNRKAVERARQRNAGAFVVVTGCYAQTDAEAAARFPGVDMVVGNDKKSRLFQLIEEKRARLGTSDAAGDATDQDAAEDRLDSDKSAPWMGLESAGYGARPVMIDPFAYGAVLPQGHTRAYLKIQEGCDRACSYCKIPMARGRGVSRAVNDVLSHVQ